MNMIENHESKRNFFQDLVNLEKRSEDISSYVSRQYDNARKHKVLGMQLATLHNLYASINSRIVLLKNALEYAKYDDVKFRDKLTKYIAAYTAELSKLYAKCNKVYNKVQMEIILSR